MNFGSHFTWNITLKYLEKIPKGLSSYQFFLLLFFIAFLFLFMFRCVATGWYSKAHRLRPLAKTPTDDGGLKGKIPAALSSHRVRFSKWKRNTIFLEFVNKPLGETKELCLHFRSDLLRNACKHQYVGETFQEHFILVKILPGYNSQGHWDPEWSSGHKS